MNNSTKKRVNITLPTDTLKKIDSLIETGGRSRFIDMAVNQYINEVGQKNLAEQLSKGAKARSSRDRDLATDWFNLAENG